MTTLKCQGLICHNEQTWRSFIYLFILRIHFHPLMDEIPFVFVSIFDGLLFSWWLVESQKKQDCKDLFVTTSIES